MHSAETSPTAIVIEAGGEPWSRVEPLLDRRIDELPVGGVLELHASEPTVATSVAAWCARRRDAFQDVTDDAVVIRIRKVTPNLIQEDR